MRYSAWPNGSSPVYFNPAWDEVVELVKTQPDTIRVCEETNGTFVAVASGYDNTHTSIIQLLKPNVPKYTRYDSYILHRNRSVEWLALVAPWNVEFLRFLGNSERVPLARLAPFVSEPAKRFLEAFLEAFNQVNH